MSRGGSGVKRPASNQCGKSSRIVSPRAESYEFIMNLLSLESRQPRLSQALAEGANGFREGEVVAGQAARRVSGQRQRHLVPRHGDVGVVAGLLGEVAHRVDVPQRVAEVLARHGPGDLRSVQLPARDGGELGLDLI